MKPQQGKTACSMANYVLSPFYQNLAPWNQYTPDIKTLVIAEGVQNIGDAAFYIGGTVSDKVTSLTLPNSVHTVGDYAFFRFLGGVTSLEIPDAVNSIGEGAFMNAGMETLVIGDGVQTIAGQAFQQCYNLQTLTIGSAVTTIDYLAFGSNTALTAIHCKPALPPAIILSIGLMSIGTFHDVPNTVNLHVPCGSTTYASSDWGVVFSNIQKTTPDPKYVTAKITQHIGYYYTGYGLRVNTAGTYTGYDVNNCHQVVYVTLIVVDCP